MGRRKLVKVSEGESLLTEELVLKALSIYSRSMPVNAVVKQMLHIEKRLGQDHKIYREAVRAILDSLVAAGRVQRETVDPHPIPDNPGLLAVDCYFLGPLERLALA